MPKPNLKRSQRRLQLVLSDQQIEELTLKVLAYGDNAEAHSAALLVLADEMIRRGPRAEDIAYVIRKTAFSRLSDDLIDAQVQLLRSELT